MGQTSSGSRTNRTGPNFDFKDEDLERETRLPLYFYKSIRALYHQETTTEKGMTVTTFVELFKGKLDLSAELQSFLSALFRAYDQDRNRYLSFREVIRMLDSLLCGTAREKIRGMFRMCDSDRDNLVNQTELTEFMKSLSCLSNIEESMTSRKSWLKHLAADLFENFDVNRDGEVSQEEFTEGCLRHPQMMKEIDLVISICIGSGF